MRRLSVVIFCLVSIGFANVADAYQAYDYDRCLAVQCRDADVAVFRDGPASGGSVINVGRTATGGVVAVGLYGEATGAVLNISNLLGQASSYRDASKTDAVSKVPGCNSAPTYAPFGSLPISPKPIAVDNLVSPQLRVSIVGNFYAGCNNGRADEFGYPPVSGTYADVFILDCRVEYLGSNVEQAVITLNGDWYRGAQGEAQFNHDGVVYHHQTARSLRGSSSFSSVIPLADFGTQGRANAMACSASVEFVADDLTATPGPRTSPAWMSVNTPVNGPLLL